MGNVSEKLRVRRKPAPLNLILQTPEALGFLSELTRKMTYDEALSKLSSTMNYLRQLDDFESFDVQKLLSFLRVHTLGSEPPSGHYRIDWISQLCKEQAIQFCIHSWQLLFSKSLFLPKNERLAQNFRMMAGILCACTELSMASCEQLCQCDGIKIIMDSLSSPSLAVETLQNDPFNANRLYIAHTSLCILRNALTSWPDAKYQFRDSNGLEICRRYLYCHIHLLKVEAFLCLTFSINEHENHVVVGGERMQLFSWIIRTLMGSILRKTHLDTVCPILYMLRAMNRLASNDINKASLANLGLLDAYTAVLRKWVGVEEVLEAILGIWSLAFEEQNRRKILTNKLLIESKCE